MTGWLRAIYDALAGAGGPSSSVTISQTTPGTTNGVVVNSSALPTGAATDSNNNTIAGAAGSSPPTLASGASGLIGWLRKIVDTLTGGTVHVIVDSAPAAGADVTDRSARLLGHVNVDNASLAVTGTFWQATQPVSGTFWPATQPISATALPLPTGAALDATLTGGTQQTKITDGTNVATVKPASTLPAATDKAVVVTARDSISVTGTFWQATQPVSGTFWQTTQPISAASLPLPTGAALDATLTGGTQRNRITDGTNNAAVKAASTAAGAADPAVVVAVSPNNSVAVTGTFWQATQPVSGTLTANAGTNLNTSALALDATLTGNNARSRITDGTNIAAVKAASTQAVAADPALVVAWSPNMGPSGNSLLPSAAASINATVVKASAGRLYKIKGYNAAAAVRYIKFWNKATAPAPATDTALIVFSYALKASDQFDIDLTPIGFAFATGIGYTISTGSANADATAVTAADIVGLNVMFA